MDKIFATFFIGFWVGILTCVLVTLSMLDNRETTIQTNKRIQPEKRLTTDGKTVDTLFIYKQDR